jgi:hypothetical protein
MLIGFTSAVLYYFFKRKAPFDYQLTSPSDEMESLPDHAPDEIKGLVELCLSFQRSDRPDAKEIFRQSLTHVTEKERILASVEISSSASETEAREAMSSEYILNLKAPLPAEKKPLDDMPSKHQGLEASALHPDSAPRAQAKSDPLNNPSQQAPDKPEEQRSTSLQKADGDDRNPLFSTDFVEIPPDIRGRIGCLVIDYERLTPREIFKPSIPDSEKWIEMELLAEDFEYDNSFVQPRSGPSRPSSRLGFLRPNMRHSSSSTSMDVSIKADRCQEFYLSDSEQYLRRLLRDWDVANWIRLKVEKGKTVYLVVGYICYHNAHVHDASSSERVEILGSGAQTPSENSTMSALSPTLHTGASLSTTSSSTDDRLCKSGCIFMMFIAWVLTK